MSEEGISHQKTQHISKDSLEDMNLKLKIRESHDRVYREEKSMLIMNKSIKGEQNGVDIVQEGVAKNGEKFRSIK